MNDLNEIELAIKGHTEATTKALDQQDQAIRGAVACLRDLEQKVLERGGGVPTYVDGAGALANELLRNAQVQDVARKASTRTSVEVKASQLLGLERKNTVVGGGFFNSTPGGIHTGLERRRFIRDYLTTVSTTQGAVSWTRESGFTNAAAIQASEGALKPESAIDFELVDSTIPTLAHFVKASNQALSDQPELLNLISGRLRYGLNVLLDSLIIGGAGTGWTVTGNHTPFTPTAGETGLDAISRAIAMLEGNEASATLILLNPGDYRSLQRVKSADDFYIYGAPSGQNGEAVWGIPILPTNAVAVGKMIAVDAAQQGVLYVREEARLDIGYVDKDFVMNLLTARGEIRALNVTIRPQAVVYGDLAAV